MILLSNNSPLYKYVFWWRLGDVAFDLQIQCRADCINKPVAFSLKLTKSKTIRRVPPWRFSKLRESEDQDAALTAWVRVSECPWLNMLVMLGLAPHD
jgi:hypothetical protein